MILELLPFLTFLIIIQVLMRALCARATELINAGVEYFSRNATAYAQEMLQPVRRSCWPIRKQPQRHKNYLHGGLRII